MIEYYRIPVKKGKIGTSQQLQISDDSELKDAIYNKNIEKIKILSFKNSNIKNDTLKLIKNIKMDLMILQLDLSQNFSFITDDAVEILCSLNNLPQLKVLNLADNQITDDSLVLISRCSWMTKLQQLILFGNSDISGEGIVILAQTPFVKKLKKLDLHATSVEDEGMSYFLKNQVSFHLQHLNLSMSWSRITNKTLYSLSISKFCSNLKVLNLQDCKVSDIGIDELCQSQNSLHLQHLNLNNSIKQKNNSITDKTFGSISLSKYLLNLRVLELRNTDITAKGIKTLASSLGSQKIQTLRLSHCQKITSQVLTYIQTLLGYQSLKKIYLNETDVDRDDFKSFQAKNPQINVIF